ncbi:MAG: YifB family Mg chelatase-like AAA ATPase [Bacteroidales bacterium]|nr:YifB family Mg chelatase-like AAA ATPase [Bacteroidales bacterium]
MLCRTYSAACIGIDAITIVVEVDVSQGISFYLVGLPDSAVRESQQRISTALQTIDARIPGKRITVNLAPADIRKEGSSFDLAIAVGILAASGQYSFEGLGNYMIMGELALDGSLRPVPGALPIAIHAVAESFKACVFPVESAYEACEAVDIDVYAANNLKEVISILSGQGNYAPVKPVDDAEDDYIDADIPDFAYIKGQEYIKRGLEIAAAGAHNVLMCGAPGSGKSLMAKAMAGILPPLGRAEAIETTMVYSVSGSERGRKGLVRKRPFRAPHYSSSAISIVGGGVKALPGEISLAHNGLLYLDELPEFSGRLLEMLRQPLEDRKISISRARYKVTYPCNFMLVASMNPCPCGYYGLPGDRCSCTPYSVARYVSRISGPLMDRIDLNIEVSPIPGDRLLGEERAEPSCAIRERVVVAREVQFSRFKGKINTNSQMGPSDIARYCPLGPSEKQLLSMAMNRLNLSARGFGKILKVARTIADLDNSANILAAHLAEAIQYR